MTPDTMRDVELLLRSNHGLIVLDSADHERSLSLLRHLADGMGLPLFLWSEVSGLRRSDLDAAVYGTAAPEQMLAHIGAAALSGIYYLAAPGPVLAGAAHVTRLVELVPALGRRGGAVIWTGSPAELPEPLRRLATVVRLPEPDLAELKRLVDGVLRDVSSRMKVSVQLSPLETRRLLNHLRGLTTLEIEKIITRAIVEDGRLSADDIAHVVAAKKEIVEREGLLEYYPAEECMTQVADLRGLKEWLSRRKHFIDDPDRARSAGLSFPKGVLLVGVPGCGKSLCARAVASEWGLPLLRMDPGGLYNKYIGETESNFRRACETAERLAPLVLFIDEIEKAFAAGGGEDGGVSQRVLGSFLSWLQDRRGEVFVVATANDVSRLPPELLRKGRFDEVFFVDLPDVESRAEILRIHLTRRRQDPAAFDLAELAGLMDGFSGAEIEQVVVSALYTAFAANAALTPEGVAQEATITRPLSVTMAEKVSALRHWAEGRTVSAN
jgi:hypothetical protein